MLENEKRALSDEELDQEEIDDDYDNSTIESERLDKCSKYSSDTTFRSIDDDTVSIHSGW